jgi:hypothetical protein
MGYNLLSLVVRKRKRKRRGEMIVLLLGSNHFDDFVFRYEGNGMD